MVRALLLRWFFYAQIQCLTQFYNKQKHIDGSTILQGGDINSLPFQLDTDSLGQGKYKMKPGWQLHLYISQLPCGAASFDCPLSPLKTNLPIEMGSQSCLGDLDNSTSEPLEDSVKNNGMQQSLEFANELLRALRGTRGWKFHITKCELHCFWCRMMDPFFDSRIQIFFDLCDRDMDGRITKMEIK
ncbi:hypothetical protein ACB092_01G042200 [Castanea dentata]